MEVLSTAGCLGVLLSYWVVESRRLARLRASIPLRIAVTGTRGKSSVTRKIASVLRESGRRAAAKTTGSRPVLIDPLGSEQLIVRRGAPSPLEQIRVLRWASRLQVEALVAEMMSIRPESLFVESRRLLLPHILIVTNVFSDHWEHWGRSRRSAARCLAAAIPEAGTMILPEQGPPPVLIRTAEERGTRILTAPDSGPAFPADHSGFPGDAALVRALADFLALDPDAVERGLRGARPDLGALKAWRFFPEGGGKPWICLSAFAANDPESTLRAWRGLARREEWARRPWIGLLNLRSDRADRTLQWLEALEGGGFPELEGLALVGGHAALCRRRLERRGWKGRLARLPGRSPASWMRALEAFAPEGTVVAGMGNIAGAGIGLIEEWNRRGEPYAL